MVVMHTFDPGTSETEEANVHELEATMVYTVRSRPARAMWGDPISKPKREVWERKRTLQRETSLHIEGQEGAPSGGSLERTW